LKESERVKADGVFSGGGVKGLAFAGAIKGAAEAGYTEWGKLAGTSAGAITAMALAVGYDATGLKEIFNKLDLSRIADYGFGGEARIPFNLAEHHGATHGVALHKWIEELIDQAPINKGLAEAEKVKTFGQLEAKTEAEKLQVIGTDLAHTRMVVFPQDVKFYVDDDGKPLVPADFPIADAVRISAGFPYFFPPMKLRDGVTKKDGVLVDGGVVSAYPIFLFDSEKPKHPTWGFRLYSGKPPESPPYQDIGGFFWWVEMGEAILDTSMNAFDRFDEKLFGPRTVAIPTGDIETLDFDLTEAEKTELFEFGHQAAKEFFAKEPKGVNLLFGATPTQST
jgi:NTE family protein